MQGFRTFVHEGLRLLVATPARLDIELQVGPLTEEVTVRATAVSTLNTEDASGGNPFVETEVLRLPFVARNPVSLLTLQPGVVFTGESDTDQLFMGSVERLDDREGTVNGVRGNQSNVTVDGIDANDWETSAAFTSALPLTLDSVQEFRVTTSNANVTDGGAAGAQVTLVTKSGSNDWHGNLRWYHRNTATAANSFFNNLSGLPTPKLIRNIGGGSLGGPLRSDRAFFFVDIEARRDSTEEPQFRNVPSETLKSGSLSYLTTVGTVATLTPADILALDPANEGVNPAMLPYLDLFTPGNRPADGRDGGLSFSGLRFNAPLKTDNKIYTARLDFKLDRQGRHTAFWRGTLGDINHDLLPSVLPGQAPASTLLNNSKGFVASYTAQLRPTITNTLRWGLTRPGIELTGQEGDSFKHTTIIPHTSFDRAEGRRIATHEIRDDMTWIRGQHTFQTGGLLRLVRNDRFTDQGSFNRYRMHPGFCVDLCRSPFFALRADGDANNDPFDPLTFGDAFMLLTGPISLAVGNFLSDPHTESLLPPGTPRAREFAEDNFAVYVQDIWRLRSDLTLTLGLRYGYASPVWEQNGFQVRPTIDVGAWWSQRRRDMLAGVPSDRSPLLSFDLAGKANNAPAWWEPDKNDFAPRVALAWSPGFEGGVGRRLFGQPGTSSVRAGFGVHFARVGGALSRTTDSIGSPGLSAIVVSPVQFTLADAPRFSGSCDSSGCTGLPPLSLFLNVPTGVTFPFVPKSDISNIGFMVDNNLSTPYTMSFALSLQRELPRSVTLDVSYVGTLGRQLLTKADLSQHYGFFFDPDSGQNYWGVYEQIVDFIGPDIFNPATPVSAIPSIEFYDNTLPNLPAYVAAVFGDPGLASLTPTQAFYVLASNFAASWAIADFILDGFPASVGISPWRSDLDPEGNGQVLFQQQFAPLSTWLNWGSSSYHSLQVSLRRAVGDSLFGFNYVLSKSIDTGSRTVSHEVTLGGFNPDIPNAFLPKAYRAVSDFDLRHNVNAHWVLAMPFGRGRAVAPDADGVLEHLVGGWQLVGAGRWRSGFPLSPEDGATLPTNFENPPPATLVGPLSTSVTKRDPNGVPNLFQDPQAARAQIAFTGPGGVGSRNVLRSPGYFSVDLGLNKTFALPWGEGHRMVFRWEAFNLFNNVNMGTVSNPVLAGPNNIDLQIDSPTFGRILGTAGPRGGAREMQFALRYEF
jgi:hypothetical protein